MIDTFKKSTILYILIVFIFISLCICYIHWAAIDSAFLPSMGTTAQIKNLHYYHPLGLGWELLHLGLDIFIFLFVYPIAFLSKSKYKISGNLFYFLFFFIIVIINILYSVWQLKYITYNSPIGILDFLVFNMVSRIETYILIIICWIIDIFIDKSK